MWSTKKDDAIREAGTPPTRAALDRRTDRHFIRLVSNSVQHPLFYYVCFCFCFLFFLFFLFLFVSFLTVTFSFTQFVNRVLYFNVTSGALIPRRSTAHREGRRISFV
jgi:hypothetical protein